MAAFAPRAAAQLEQADVGPFFINTLDAPGSNTTYKGVIVRLGGDGEAAVCFDTELLRMSVGWVRGEADGKPVAGWAGLYDPRSSTSFTASHGGPPTVGVYTGKKPEKGKPAPGGASQVRFATKVGPGWAGGTSGDDLADPRTPPKANPKAKLGPLPKAWGRWKGVHRHGDQVVLSFNVGGVDVLEVPGLTGAGAHPVFTRTIRLDKSDKPMTLVVADLDGAGQSSSNSSSSGGGATVAVGSADHKVGNEERTTAWAIGQAPSGVQVKQDGGRVLAVLPARSEPAVFQVAVWSGPRAAAEKAAGELKALASGAKPVDPTTLTKGGPARWGEPLETKGALATSGGAEDAYVVDTLTAPYKNPWNALLRFAGFDFFPDGKRAAVSTIGGDVYVVSGIDGKLEKLTWKRFATGLFQPLGLKVVDGHVYTIGRDGLTRLVDLNGDGEADLYENVNNDAQVTTNYHEFCLDLQTDPEGNFYYPKGSPWPPDVKSDHQGTMIKVSKDGSKFEVIATGLRAPNGTGMSPDGRVLTAGDNQGHWMPSSKVSWIRPGKFYGMVQAAHTPDGSKPTDFEQPLLWLPMGMDNSSGGQVWAPKDGKWGPLDGRLLHLSYGKSTLFNVMTEEVGGVMQGAAVAFPLKFESSLMRARFNPADGQLYVAGLKGWQTNAGKDGALHRVRYTGKPARMPVDYRVRKDGIAITFAVPLDRASAADAGNWSAEQWNYAWTGNYGSPEFSPKDPKKKGHDEVEIKSVTLSADGKTVLLQIPGLQPVHQMKIRCNNVRDASGAEVKWEIYGTINRVGEEPLAGK